MARVGLWSKVESKPIFTTRSRSSDGSHNKGLGTLFQAEDRASQQEVIELTTLDDFAAREQLDRLDAIKIDVEGAELEVIRGGTATIQQFRPVILLEVSRVCLQAAGTSETHLLEHLSRWYRFELVRRNGRSRPIDIADLGAYQNILCLPTSQPASESK
jgi:hypothetical protein